MNDCCERFKEGSSTQQRNEMTLLRGLWHEGAPGQVAPHGKVSFLGFLNFGLTLSAIFGFYLILSLSVRQAKNFQHTQLNDDSIGLRKLLKVLETWSRCCL